MAQFYNINFLHEVDGLSQRQIAKKLGVSINTVKKYLMAKEAPNTTAPLLDRFDTSTAHPLTERRIVSISSKYETSRNRRRVTVGARGVWDSCPWAGIPNTNSSHLWDLIIIKWLTFEVIALAQFHIDKNSILFKREGTPFLISFSIE
ncbi:sigma factor-like helix-turn-helix DNA-binding protein [Terrilactibacillus laevilacticus]|uniref:Sigma factor-like helix-turn-helix DNA-binding protein n=1 Tax=Terrilactibacillus laevilacticus TaxID=1380157 RepID=A0ABW5PV77_9BACI|nr:sigma factor-like helix-turn-helix DNA-binding protein [Terrilactibacillus laevilacticus]